MFSVGCIAVAPVGGSNHTGLKSNECSPEITTNYLGVSTLESRFGIALEVR